jgi:origin recognition complex subunit 3
LQPFFVLHKAAPVASSGPASRGRRRTDASQPSSPGPKSSRRSRDVDAADEDGSELYERLRMEAFHRTWSKIQSTIDVCLSLLRITILT